MSPSSLGGKQTTTSGEHISQLVRREASPVRETLIGRFSSKEEKFEQWRYNKRLLAVAESHRNQNY